MNGQLDDLATFVSVVEAGGFRDAARVSGASASGFSEAIRRLETRLGVRLLNRTTRSVTPTAAGRQLYESLCPALSEIVHAIDTVNDFRDRPAGTLRLNVPANIARTALAPVIVPFLKEYPEIRIEVTAEDSFIDMVGGGYDAGIRYDERLEQDMIALPIGPRTQRIMIVGAPSYFAEHGRPQHPRDLLQHRCLCGRFAGGRLTTWELEKDGEIVRINPDGPLISQPGSASDLLIQAAVGGLGLTSIFEDWMRPELDSGALEPVLEDWCPPFAGPFLYYAGRRYLPAPLRAFVDFVKRQA
ncbi:Bacterial regulatory helix-turn-helix, lysR family protein [Sphingobium chlorophenolicum]|uniref:Bacterial regulatory helix-turn-helix, lysR family protein n=2 Tax=Sphingobium chlorophenolicum TaxID=46429 RepID=A0A081REI3_SPHCR|nr:LysR family transcriptional regulator [Sphingobium chlorophenolicum]KEQ53606.1 Bacterial regulatory helix-turn-helix, lysR family protein [Sphingobium chlorophenolicum]